MTDYIDRQALIDLFQRVSYDDWNQGVGTTWANAYKEAAALVEAVPPADVEPVRHGRWMFSPCHSEGVCSLCQYKIYGRPYQNTYLIVPYNYCPNCGARMDANEDGGQDGRIRRV